MKFKHLALVISLTAATAIAQDLPKPQLRLVAVTDHVNNGHEVKIYEIEVVNRDEFDNDLFIDAPVLPPCGENANASRTWMNVYRENKRRVYGWCVIPSSAALASLKFMIPAADPQPKKISIDMVDRAEGKVARSNIIKIE